MKTNATYFIDLITRYFYSEATPGEIHELETWVKSDPANAQTFSEYQKTWKTIEHTRIASSIDLDLEWNDLKVKVEKLPSSVRPPQYSILPWLLRIAAVFLFLAVPSFFLYKYLNHPGEKQLTATTEMVEQTLPDGTVVTLNSGATLSYPDRFEGSFRRVTLQGEAWFEVARDKTKPFIVAVENVRIRVVGTTFFVNSKSYHHTREVILSTGLVKVYYENKPEKTAFLLPGDKAELSCDGYTIAKTTNEDVNFLSWKTKHIVLSNTPLNEVVALLTKVYHTSVSLSNDGLNDCRITATFDRQSLESILNVLKATLDLEVRITGTGIELSAHGCQPRK